MYQSYIIFISFQRHFALILVSNYYHLAIFLFSVKFPILNIDRIPQTSVSSSSIFSTNKLKDIFVRSFLHLFAKYLGNILNLHFDVFALSVFIAFKLSEHHTPSFKLKYL